MWIPYESAGVYWQLNGLFRSHAPSISLWIDPTATTAFNWKCLCWWQSRFNRTYDRRMSRWGVEFGHSFDAFTLLDIFFSSKNVLTVFAFGSNVGKVMGKWWSSQVNFSLISKSDGTKMNNINMFMTLMIFVLIDHTYYFHQAIVFIDVVVQILTIVAVWLKLI